MQKIPTELDRAKVMLERLSKNTGMSQAQIGRMLDIPSATLNAWTTGRVRCRHAAMLRLALEGLAIRIEGPSPHPLFK